MHGSLSGRQTSAEGGDLVNCSIFTLIIQSVVTAPISDAYML